MLLGGNALEEFLRPLGEAFAKWIGTSAHLGEFTLGIIAGATISCLLMWIVLKMVPQANAQWQGICNAKDREIKELKKELREKDARIEKCHDEIGQLRRAPK